MPVKSTMHATSISPILEPKEEAVPARGASFDGSME